MVMIYMETLTILWRFATNSTYTILVIQHPIIVFNRHSVPSKTFSSVIFWVLFSDPIRLVLLPTIPVFFYPFTNILILLLSVVWIVFPKPGVVAVSS